MLGFSLRWGSALNSRSMAATRAKIWKIFCKCGNYFSSCVISITIIFMKSKQIARHFSFFIIIIIIIIILSLYALQNSYSICQ
jgi:hypothetical protein